jgi:hypothetical protein
MPRLEIHRADLRVVLEREGVQIVSRNIAQSIKGRVSTPHELVERVSRSDALKDWSTVHDPAARGTDRSLDRITVDVRDLGLHEQPWESVLSEIRTDIYQEEPAVVRVSPVRPRCANFPFTLPLRLLEINPSDGGQLRPAISEVFHDNPLEQYASALRVEQLWWSYWNETRLPKDWPSVDVLHFERLPRPPSNSISSDASIPGTLGWLVAHLVLWQVRLVVFHAPSGAALKRFRRLAGAVIARGGPAILVESFRDTHERRDFFRLFYADLIHDSPIDWMWHDALRSIQANPADGSLFVGAGREDQLRPSNVAMTLSRFGSPANRDHRIVRINAFARDAIGHRALTQREFAANIERNLQKLNSGSGNYRFDFREGEGMLPVSEVLTEVRGNSSRHIYATDLLTSGVFPAVHKRSPRFVNASFWEEKGAGDLSEVDQKSESFKVDQVYHLGIQIGPKKAGVIVANETALLEEVFKWDPKMKGTWIEVGVTGIDFEVIGDPVQRLWLPVRGPSEIVYFAVVPHKAGACRLRFSVFYEQNVLQSFRIAAIAGTPASDRAATLAHALGISKRSSLDAAYLSLLEFSLTSSIEHFAAAQTPSEQAPRRRALSIIVNDWDEDSVITVKGSSNFSVNVSRRLPDYVSKLQSELREISKIDGEAYPYTPSNEVTREQLEQAMRILADRGRTLFVDLFDGAVWGDLEDSLSTPDQTIQVAQILREKVIPWSVIYGRPLKPLSGDRDASGRLVNAPVCLAALPQANGDLTVKQCGSSSNCVLATNPLLAPENVICPLEFWGFKHAIEVPPQQIESPQRSNKAIGGIQTEIEVDGNVKFVAGVNCEFPSEQSHFEDLDKLVGMVSLSPLLKEYTAKELMQQLASSPVHVAYFFCHARGGSDSADSQLILEAPGTKKPEPILWYEFAQLLGGRQRWNPPTLVFLNACQTANYNPEALSPFLRSFVDQLGASGLIGTEIPVWDPFAAEMALNFFSAFFNGRSAGMALLSARRALLAKRNPLGLVYTLHASADLRLVSVAREPAVVGT